MCKRDKKTNSLELCEAAELATGRGFPLGNWTNVKDFGNPVIQTTRNHAIKSGEFSKGAGIKINFCPFTGEDVRPYPRKL